MPSDMVDLVLDAAQGDVVAQLLLEISEPVSVSEAAHAVAAIHTTGPSSLSSDTRLRLGEQWASLLESSLSVQGERAAGMLLEQLTAVEGLVPEGEVDHVDLAASLLQCTEMPLGQERLLARFLVEEEWSPEMLGGLWALTLSSPERCSSLAAVMGGGLPLSQQWLRTVLVPALLRHPQWRSRILRGVRLMLAALEHDTPLPPLPPSPAARVRAGRVHRARLIRHSPPPLLAAEAVLVDPPRTSQRRSPARRLR